MGPDSILVKYGVHTDDTTKSPSVTVKVTRNYPGGQEETLINNVAVTSTEEYYLDQNLSAQTVFTYSIKASFGGHHTNGTDSKQCTG